MTALPTMFEQFRQILTIAVNDPQFVTANKLLQNATFKADVLARITALAPDIALFFDYEQITGVTGGWVQDPVNRVVSFDPSAALPLNTISFSTKALSVPHRLVGVSPAAVLPSDPTNVGPNARVTVALDASDPDAVINSTLTVSVDIDLNAGPGLSTWTFSSLVVMLSQE